MIRDTKVGDKGMESVGTLTNLVALELNGTQVTDAGLSRLISLKRLEKLWICQTACGDSGVIELQSALPRCRIYQLPTRAFRVHDAEALAGRWTDGLNKSTLFIHRGRKQRFLITTEQLGVATSSTNASRDIEGRYFPHTGTIMLSRPLGEESGQTYQRLFPVAFSGRLSLLPSSRLLEFEQRFRRGEIPIDLTFVRDDEE